MLIQDNKHISQEGRESDHVESGPPENGTGSETENQEPLVRVDPSSKSTDNDDDDGDSGSKSEGVQDEKDPAEQIALNADVDSDKDADVADDCASPNTSSNPGKDNEDENTIIGVQSSTNPENESCFSELSTDNKSQSQSRSQRFSGFDLNQEVCSEQVVESGTDCNANRRLGFLDFNLNVAEEDGQEGKMVISHGLNNASSSSSSSKQPISRNIDLNSTDLSNGQHSVISIFGTRFSVKQGMNESSSRDVHVPPFAPQITGSQPPFPLFMNMGAPGALVGVSGLRPPTPQAHVGGGLRQFFPQNGNEQGSLSSVLGKREPDSTWQLFPINKHRQPPWR